MDSSSSSSSSVSLPVSSVSVSSSVSSSVSPPLAHSTADVPLISSDSSSSASSSSSPLPLVPLPVSLPVPLVSPPDPLFIDWSSVTSSLSSVLGDGLLGSLLISSEGHILSLAGLRREDRVISALIGTIWTSYQNAAAAAVAVGGENEEQGNEMNTTGNAGSAAGSASGSASASAAAAAGNLSLMQLECAGGRVCVVRIGLFLLCLVAEKNLSQGNLQLKLQYIKQILQPLQLIQHIV